MSAEADTAAPPMVGRRVRLRPLTSTDYGWLYDIGVGHAGGWRWRHRGSTPSPEAHLNSLWNDALVNHVAERRSDGRRVAYLTAIRTDFRNGHCYFAAIADPSFSRSAHAAEAIGLFLVNLMVSFPFRKIYIETPAFNTAQFGPGLARFFQEEGRLREYEYYDGRLWDYLIYSVSRSVVELQIAPLIVIKSPMSSPAMATNATEEAG